MQLTHPIGNHITKIESCIISTSINFKEKRGEFPLIIDQSMLVAYSGASWHPTQKKYLELFLIPVLSSSSLLQFPPLPNQQMSMPNTVLISLSDALSALSVNGCRRQLLGQWVLSCPISSPQSLKAFSKPNPHSECGIGLTNK